MYIEISSWLLVLVLLLLLVFLKQKKSPHLIFPHSIEWMGKLQYRQQSKLQFREKVSHWHLMYDRRSKKKNKNKNK